jgi:hypothetical protein
VNPSIYPVANRTAWIRALRPEKPQNDPTSTPAFLFEQEPQLNAAPARALTLFLINKECPWTCLMCDLWKYTTNERVAPGTIPAQIEKALTAVAAELNDTSTIKLYNAGSFFDPAAIPPCDYGDIARLCQKFSRVVVESHPALIGDSVVQFRDLLDGQLEIAMGLETVHPQVLPKLNKKVTLSAFAAAAKFLQENRISLRTFVLHQPPFIVSEPEALAWTRESVQFAINCGSRLTSIIPTRTGNGAMEQLAAAGEFALPTLDSLHTALATCINRETVVMADLWDLEHFSRCSHCFPQRKTALERMNFEQGPLPNLFCTLCQS